MPTICTFLGIVIRMYFDEHAPPHFHVIYNECEAAISIERMDIIRGGIPGRILGLVVEWAVLHKKELLENWERCARHEHPIRLDPLI